MDHPFSVGKKYKNHLGRYEVLSITPPKMAVRYDDGREQILTIETQARIWSNIAIDKREAKKKPQRAASKKVRRSRAWTNRGQEFTGLKESDFKESITHTEWRNRQNLGGLVALLVSEGTKEFYQSYAVSRRPEVHIYLPDHFDTTAGRSYAKLDLRLDETAAYARFYVEKANEKMDKKWHWWHFLQALETDKKLPKQIMQAMAEQALVWQIEFEHEGVYQPDKTVQVSTGNPLLRQDADGEAEIEWAEFITELKNLPADDWCNVFFGRTFPKEEALETAERFGAVAAQVLLAAVPLYLASVGGGAG